VWMNDGTRNSMVAMGDGQTVEEYLKDHPEMSKGRIRNESKEC